MERIKPKGLAELLAENPSLGMLVTYEDIENGALVPKNSDEKLEDVYNEYKEFMAGNGVV